MYTTEGIVLKTTTSGEYDEIASIYTQDFGKIKARAKSAKKVNTKQGNYLHNFARLRFSFVSGKGISILSGAQTASWYPELQKNLIPQAYVISFFNLCDNIIYEENPDERIYNLFCNALEDAENNAVYRNKLWKKEKEWLINLLSLMGHKPSNLNLQNIKSPRQLDHYLKQIMQNNLEVPVEFFGEKVNKTNT